MSDEQRPPDEEEQDNEAPVAGPAEAEEAPKPKPTRVAQDYDEYEPITVEDLKNEAREIADRVKAAGLNPLRRIARGIVYPLLDMVDGFADALEGNKRKKGD